MRNVVRNFAGLALQMAALLLFTSPDLLACRDAGGTPYACIESKHCNCATGWGAQPGWDQGGTVGVGRCVVLIGAPDGADCGCDYGNGGFGCGVGAAGSGCGTKYRYS